MHYHYSNLLCLWNSNRQTSEYQYMSHIQILIDFVCWNPDIILVKPIDLADLSFCCNKFLLKGQSPEKLCLHPPYLEASYLQPFSCTDHEPSADNITISPRIILFILVPHIPVTSKQVHSHENADLLCLCNTVTRYI
jgi:hypothetical protein